MTEQGVIDIGLRAILVTMQVAAPVLLAILAAGVIISVIQAATQIHEQTLSFIPKILAMTLVLMIFGPWTLKVMLEFTAKTFRDIPQSIK